jgi:hypothetical protein
MATTKQIEANRRNALKSTGPSTPEAKAAVRMNALRHGLRARTVVLPAENPEDFHQLCSDLETEWQPQSRTEHFYVEQMAISQWKLTRVEIAEKSIVSQEVSAKTQIPLLDKLWQCQGRLERSFARAQRELERLQNSRRPPVQPGEAASAPKPEAPASPAAVEPTARKAPYIMFAPAAPAAAPKAAATPRVEARRRAAA